MAGMRDTDRIRLGEMLARAMDALDEFGDDAELIGATIVFEARTPVEDDPHDAWAYHGSYQSTQGTSPAHAGGMAQQLANWLLAPDAPEDP